MKHYIPEYPKYENNQARVIIHCESGRRTKGMFYWNGTKPTFASFGMDVTESVIAWEYEDDYLFHNSNITNTLEGCPVKEGDFIKSVRFSHDLIFTEGWRVEKVGGKLGIYWGFKKEFTPFENFASRTIFEKGETA